jgi:hypothetical protein
MPNGRGLRMEGESVIVTLRRIICGCVVAAAVSAAGSAVAIAVKLNHIEREKPFREREFEEVLAGISAGKSKPDPRGVVALSGKASGLTINGRVYVTRGEAGRLLVFFPSWIGRQELVNPVDPGDNWVEGYLFDSSGVGGGPISAPGYAPPWRVRTDSGVQTICVDPYQQLGRHWFHVAPFS